ERGSRSRSKSSERLLVTREPDQKSVLVSYGGVAKIATVPSICTAVTTTDLGSLAPWWIARRDHGVSHQRQVPKRDAVNDNADDVDFIRPRMDYRVCAGPAPFGHRALRGIQCARTFRCPAGLSERE